MPGLWARAVQRYRAPVVLFQRNMAVPPPSWQPVMVQLFQSVPPVGVVVVSWSAR